MLSQNSTLSKSLLLPPINIKKLHLNHYYIILFKWAIEVSFPFILVFSIFLTVNKNSSWLDSNHQSPESNSSTINLCPIKCLLTVSIATFYQLNWKQSQHAPTMFVNLLINFFNLSIYVCLPVVDPESGIVLFFSSFIAKIIRRHYLLQQNTVAKTMTELKTSKWANVCRNQNSKTFSHLTTQ